MFPGHMHALIVTVLFEAEQHGKFMKREYIMSEKKATNVNHVILKQLIGIHIRTTKINVHTIRYRISSN